MGAFPTGNGIIGIKNFPLAQRGYAWGFLYAVA
jgi:hypothetical protein